MKKTILLLLFFLPPAFAAERVPVNTTAHVAFSPDGDGTGLIVGAVGRAQSEVLVQAYVFTSAPIAQALANAKRRGVDVKIILDRTNETGQYSVLTYLKHNGVPVWIDDAVKIAHNKTVVIDRKTLITGSFNFTKAAETHNAENVLLLEDAPALAAEYARDWYYRQKLSRVADKR